MHQALKFIVLSQGLDIVKEYANKFNNFARYAFGITHTKIGCTEDFVYEFDLFITREMTVGT